MEQESLPAFTEYCKICFTYDDTPVSHGMPLELNDGYQQIQDMRFWQLQKLKCDFLNYDNI